MQDNILADFREFYSESLRIHNLKSGDEGVTYFQKIGMIREREIDIALTELEKEIGKGGHIHNPFDERFAHAESEPDGEELIDDIIFVYEAKNQIPHKQSPDEVNRGHRKKFSKYREGFEDTAKLVKLNIVAHMSKGLEKLRKEGHEFIEVGFKSLFISRSAINTIKYQWMKLLAKYNLIDSSSINLPMSMLYSSDYVERSNYVDELSSIKPISRESLIKYAITHDIINYNYILSKLS